MGKKESPKAEIKKICQDIVLISEIEEQRNQLEIELMNARQQFASWERKISQIEGAIANCNILVEKKTRPKTLIMDNKVEDKKDEPGS